VERFNLTKAGRTSSGLMTMELIAKKRKLTFTYEVISGKDLDSILSLIDSSKMFFPVEYPDVDGKQHTITAYAGSIPYEHFRRDSGEYWRGVSFSLIEQ